MSNETAAPASAPDPDPAFVHAAAAAGLDTADADRMADLQRRVAALRRGLVRLDEIPVAGTESPSFFVPQQTAVAPQSQ